MSLMNMRVAAVEIGMSYEWLRKQVKADHLQWVAPAVYLTRLAALSLPAARVRRHSGR